MNNEGYKVILFEGVTLFLILWFEQWSSKWYLVRMTIVRVDYEEKDRDSTEKASNKGKKLIEFLKASLIFSSHSWLE